MDFLNDPKLSARRWLVKDEFSTAIFNGLCVYAMINYLLHSDSSTLKILKSVKVQLFFDQ